MTSDTATQAWMKAQQAEAKADRALAKQDDHERVCAERYQGIREDIKGLKGIILKAAIGLLIGLTSVCGFLLADKFF